MLRATSVCFVCLLSYLWVGSVAYGETYQVSDLKELHALCASRANPGDVIELQPGTYYLEEARIPVLRSGEPGKPIIIRGVVKNGKRPVIDASRVNVKRGIFRTEAETHDVVFEDLELRNAQGSRFPDRETFSHNAGAIYFQGTRLTARRLHVHHNEDGFFSTHAADEILVENCEIDHNGTAFAGRHNPTHNFYFCAHRQTVRNCYIHHSGEAQNFKSRGWHTVFAYNWVEEDAGYSVEVASGNEGNTLWIGNVVIKRRAPGRQRRLLGVGDGTSVAKGTLTMINNTFVSTTAEDLYLFTEASSTCDVALISNVFAGPSRIFLEKNGKGRITGTNNWFLRGTEVPDTLTHSLFGDDPGFVNLAGRDLRPRRGSPLVNAGVAKTQYLNEDQKLEPITPAFSPTRQPLKSLPRRITGAPDLGAFEYQQGNSSR